MSGEEVRKIVIEAKSSPYFHKQGHFEILCLKKE